MTEKFELCLSQYYDGNEIHDGHKCITLKETVPEKIYHEIIGHIPDPEANIEKWENKETLTKWIRENRNCDHWINDSITVLTTNTHDVSEDKRRFVTYEFSGTYYDLWHIIERENDE